ncbi:MAG: lipocalin family protein [Bacteroidota bacterium]
MMDKVKVLALSYISFLLFLACSTDNEDGANTNNAIVGDWILVSRTVAEIQVALDECETFVVMTIQEDQTLFSQFNTTEIPERCQNLAFFQLTWEKGTGNLYNVNLGNTLVSTLELSGNQLIERIADNDWVNFYERAE